MDADIDRRAFRSAYVFQPGKEITAWELANCLSIAINLMSDNKNFDFDKQIAECKVGKYFYKRMDRDA